MDDWVTTHAITYMAIQVCHPFWPLLPYLYYTQLHFALNNATQWTSHYNGFNYQEFYKFIINFLKDDQTREGSAATDELFDWWNRYV